MRLGTKLVAMAFINAALVLPLSGALGADMGPDPAIGSWKLNVEKSKFDAADMSVPKSAVRTYAEAPGGLKVSIQSMDAAGASHESSSTFTYDGKQHPVTGVPDYNTIAVTRVDKFTSKTDLIQGGKVIGHLQRVVSKDGKTLTVTVDLTNAKGAKEHEVTVYDRQ